MSVSQQVITNDADTFDLLVKKVRAISALNRDTLETIKSRMNEEVVTGYDYSLDHDGGDDGDDKANTEWTVRSRPRKRKIGDVVDEWSNDSTTEGLERDPFFEDKVDLSTRDFDDLRRLTEEMRTIGDKYAECMRDAPKVRDGLRIVLSNMMKLQVYLGEIHARTLNVQDSVQGNDDLSREMKRIAASFEEIRKQVPTMELSVRMNGPFESSKQGEQVLVRDAGQVQVNGVYKKGGSFNGVETYKKRAWWEGKLRLFCIYRWRYEDWYISALADENDGPASNDVDFYVVEAKDEAQEKPPKTGWRRIMNGNNPPPTIFYVD